MAGTGDSVRLLVVDDDVSFVTFVGTALEKLGVAADVALTGNDAGLRLKKEAFGGVLLDLNLPDSLGLDVLRTMRRCDTVVTSRRLPCSQVPEPSSPPWRP